jgi:PPE-repeat protein
MGAWGDAATVTPELNHTMMIAGDLGESLVQAAAGYESVADMLLAELTAMGLNTSTTAAVAWQGPAGEMYELTAAQFCAICATVSAWVRIGQTQAAEVAAAHAAAVEMMIPAEACVTNRVTQGGLVSTNWFGQNFPGIYALDHQYYGHFWVTNALARTQYGQTAWTALAAISEPAPFTAMAPDPAAPAEGVAESAGQNVMQVSTQSMTQTAETSGNLASGGGSGGGMSSFAGQAVGMFSQAGSMLGQAPQALQQFPSMLGQAPSMFSGLLGPLMSGANGASPVGALGGEAAGALAGPAAGGGLAGGGGLLSTPTSVATSLVRPANSFSPPNAPTLPAGWQGEAGSGQDGAARPAGMGGGGLYGAPQGMGRDGHGSQSSEKSSKPMQVTARSAADRGERQRVS